MTKEKDQDKEPEMELYTEKDKDGNVIFATMVPKGSKSISPNQQ